jgi:hypothetical protein
VWSTLRISIVWKVGLHSGHRRHQQSARHKAAQRSSEGLFHSLSPRFAGKLRAVHSREARAALYQATRPSLAVVSCVQSGRLPAAGKQSFGINEAVRGIADAACKSVARQ